MDFFLPEERVAGTRAQKGESKPKTSQEEVTHPDLCPCHHHDVQVHAKVVKKQIHRKMCISDQ